MSRTTTSTATDQHDAVYSLSASRSCPAPPAMSRDRLAYNAHVERLREAEYPMLKDNTYLDHAGMTLPSKSLLDTFTKSMTSTIIGNPHSAYSPSQLTSSRIEDIRVRVLQLFNADPAEFDLVFVANATAGVKLVAEALRAAPDGFDYLYHQFSHTSLVGLRREAEQSACLDDGATERWLAGGPPSSSIDDETAKRLLLFSYPAQSNLDGSRLPLNWSRRCRSRNPFRQCLTLLDAAAYVSTAPLSFANLQEAPDFTVFSFYKIFGFPDLGGLIVRRSTTASLLLGRRYFGGGTVEAMTCGAEQGEDWHAIRSETLHDALEDGTLPVHNIMALDIAMKTHTKLFGSMAQVSLHASYLADQLYPRLDALRHENGRRVCVLYPRGSGQTKGPIVAFNILTSQGPHLSPTKFQELAILKDFHVRTGGVCNPGGVAAALGLSASDIKRNHAEGYRCGGADDVFEGKPAGVIRVSFGAMSTLSDVDKFCSFIREYCCTAQQQGVQRPAALSSGHLLGSRPCTPGTMPPPDFEVRSIVVFPIKSCQGFVIPRAKLWDMTAKGLAWDREWCLVSRATNRIMNQKRYPRMALLRPHLNIEENIMTIYYAQAGHNMESISLSMHPGAVSRATAWAMEPFESSITGVKSLVRKYTSPSINDFFSRVLETPCILARISSSEAKESNPPATIPGAFPEDTADTDTAPTSLSNESPILAINMSSVNLLNQQIKLAGGDAVSAESFRANIILGPSPSSTVEVAYMEDNWTQLQIGPSKLNVLGPCQRCHMVCIDPKTATKRAEPYVTLSKTRRIEGKVVFGCHLALADSLSRTSLKIGDKVLTRTQ